MKEIVIAGVLIGIAHWYFNIRSKNKCIVLNPKCSGIKCIKQKL